MTDRSMDKDKKGNESESQQGKESEMEKLMNRYLDWMQTRGYTPDTINNSRYGIICFITWCDERGISSPNEVSTAVLARYQRYLYHHRKEDGGTLSLGTQRLRLVVIRSFFRWLARNHLILFNPASELELPKMDNRLPRNVLSLAEVEKILHQVDLSTLVGLRDRAILELLFCTGIRRNELINLKLYDVNIEKRTLFIRRGKGKKDRVVPTGERALLWLEKYLDESRPVLVSEGKRADKENNALFLNAQGGAMRDYILGKVVRKYIKSAGIDKEGGCHLFRHSMATLMLEGGADIRYIQQMLGHAKLDTTQIYTRVSISKLKEVHMQTHPGALLKPKRKRK
jgi:integrase/recombinase XerD